MLTIIRIFVCICQMCRKMTRLLRLINIIMFFPHRKCSWCSCRRGKAWYGYGEKAVPPPRLRLPPLQFQSAASGKSGKVVAFYREPGRTYNALAFFEATLHMAWSQCQWCWRLPTCMLCGNFEIVAVTRNCMWLFCSFVLVQNCMLIAILVRVQVVSLPFCADLQPIFEHYVRGNLVLPACHWLFYQNCFMGLAIHICWK